MQLLRTPAFLGIAVPFALGVAAQVGFIVHEIAILAPSIGSIGASLAIALTSACAMAARLLLSLFVDRLHQRGTTAVLLVNQAVALIIIAESTEPLALYLACCAFGVTVGNLITLPALIIQREFPAEAFAPVVSLTTAVIALTYAMAPALLGILRDATHGYRAPLYLCVAAEVLAAGTVLLRPRPARL